MNINIKLIKLIDEEPPENQECLFILADYPNRLFSGIYDIYSCTFLSDGFAYDADNVIGWCLNNISITY